LEDMAFTFFSFIIALLVLGVVVLDI
jgi:hypothetical protein